MDLAEQLERLAPFGQGNPDPRLIVPSAAAAHGPADGPGGQATRASTWRAGPAGRRASPSASTATSTAREDEPLDVSVKLEVDRWNGAVQPRVVLRELYPLARTRRGGRGNQLRRGRLPVLRLRNGGRGWRPRLGAPRSPSRPRSGAAAGTGAGARDRRSPRAAPRWPRSRSSSPAASRCSRSASTPRRRRALADSAADPRRFGAGEAGARLLPMRRDALRCESACSRRTAPGWCLRTGARWRAGPTWPRAFAHVVLVDPPAVRAARRARPRRAG